MSHIRCSQCQSEYSLNESACPKCHSATLDSKGNKVNLPPYVLQSGDFDHETYETELGAIKCRLRDIQDHEYEERGKLFLEWERLLNDRRIAEEFIKTGIWTPPRDFRSITCLDDFMKVLDGYWGQQRSVFGVKYRGWYQVVAGDHNRYGLDEDIYMKWIPHLNDNVQFTKVSDSPLTFQWPSQHFIDQCKEANKTVIDSYNSGFGVRVILRGESVVIKKRMPDQSFREEIIDGDPNTEEELKSQVFPLGYQYCVQARELDTYFLMELSDCKAKVFRYTQTVVYINGIAIEPLFERGSSFPFGESEARRRQKEASNELKTPVVFEIDLVTIKMPFILIPPGVFVMGGEAEEGGGESERPRHKVRISEPFYIAKHPCTQEEWSAILSKSPAYFKDSPKNPIEKVSWNDFYNIFIPAIQRRAPTGMEFDLPTEAEWEYACRAGTSTPFHFGGNITTDLVNYDGRQPYGDAPEGKNRGRTTPVWAYPENPWGLQDVHGNVYEWCKDWYDENYYSHSPEKDPENTAPGAHRVIRGGSYSHSAFNSRSSSRNSGHPENRYTNVGFRPTIRLVSIIAWKRQQEAARSMGLAPAISVKLPYGASMEFMLIPPGEFLMGAPESVKYAGDCEKPQRRVRITKPFYLAKYPCTQQQWEAITLQNPSKFKGAPTLPVEQVSWDDVNEKLLPDIQEYAPTGMWFRLPTEAQWEYACRAGTSTPFHFGAIITTDQVNYNGKFPYGNAPKGQSRGKTTPVGTFPANAWGLHDMHGNVWEWCRDWYAADFYSNSPTDDPENTKSSSRRVLRGGCWYNGAGYCRSAYRGFDIPDTRDGVSGFRLALDIK